ncbi:type II toxin-antitoxin system RelE/ParE family toxin [Testudinibacter sp. TR-2022]|uniref:type II toxin-antitoxin system RelE/ParE family toxin n=1 Tax=Testudinibacter sp. TR-2022 TaxID=2585029 RepID=UPI00111ADB81|nr:type II toxin-antitoxin system RelE/ParE family toxin [Testudinibacter sp. TR-2022]TNH06491.1 type II toxin-antitoxin system RelE/ParE family toxin [Pasteurellaceae bacterium Phil11]TNH21939.1 type II toxin-antitoxin system RelE/ParE family toxin [Testudinibacter sp. TR-2022]TNH27505.1 type II toxin-antitoxin system RelE/ParE family toxin [Testudinibacter sp. TR-2022]
MYKLSKLAEHDFAKITRYSLINFGAQKASDYLLSLENALLRLAASPLIGKKCTAIDTTLMSFPHQQHTIFYRVRKNDIFVVRILHQQMETKLHISYN